MALLATGWSIPVLTVTSGPGGGQRTPENTKHNNSQGLLGPAGTCCLLSSHHLPGLPGERGGGGGCPLKILSGGREGGEEGEVASQSPQHYLDTGRT